MAEARKMNVKNLIVKERTQTTGLQSRDSNVERETSSIERGELKAREGVNSSERRPLLALACKPPLPISTRTGSNSSVRAALVS